MNFNVFQTMDLLEELLGLYFIETPFEFKSSDNTITYKKEVPHIYKWAVPMDDRNSMNYPNKIPSIALILDSLDANGNMTKASITAHTAVVNPAISDSEICVYDAKKERWIFKDDAGYTQDKAYMDLYQNSLLLGTELITVLNRISKGALSLSNLDFTPPDTEMADFPYSTSSVSFDVSYRLSNRSIPEDYKNLL